MAQSSLARISYAQLVVPLPSPLLSSFPRYLVRHLSSSSLRTLSKSIVLLLSQCHPQLAKVLSSGTYNFWHLGINFSSCSGMNRGRGEVTFSKMTTKCSERRLQKLSASALGHCNNFPDTQRSKSVAKVGNDSPSRRESLTSQLLDDPVDISISTSHKFLIAIYVFSLGFIIFP